MHVTMLSPRRAQVKHGSKTYYVTQESPPTENGDGYDGVYVVDDGDEPKRLKAADFAGAVEKAELGAVLYVKATPAMTAQVRQMVMPGPAAPPQTAYPGAGNTYIPNWGNTPPTPTPTPTPASATPASATPTSAHDPRLQSYRRLPGSPHHEYLFDDGVHGQCVFTAPDEADAVRQYDNFLAKTKAVTP